MSNIITITDDTPVLLNTTPAAGGHGREAKVHLGDNADVEGVILEGHNGIPRDGAPASDDDGWFTVIEDPETYLVEVADLPQWVRLGGDAEGPVQIEGVQ